MAQKGLRFCPNCGSTRVEPDTSNRAETYFSGGNPNNWSCKDCDYTGIMPEGDPEKDYESSSEEIEFNPEEEYSREYTGFGKGYLKYLIYVLLPATIIYILFRLMTQ